MENVMLYTDKWHIGGNVGSKSDNVNKTKKQNTLKQ